MSLALALLLAQVGPGGAIQHAPLEIPRQRKGAAGAPMVLPPRPLPTPPERFQACLAALHDEENDGLQAAQAWQHESSGATASWAAQCVGNGYNRLGRWADAAGAFTTARDLAPEDEPGRRAVLGAMAGLAAFDAGDYARSDTLFVQAHADALRSDRAELAGSVAIKHAMPLVALKRDAEAGESLAEGREKSPDDYQGWLLSATLSRRQGKLALAQQQIERAAELMPIEPEIALEAGVIAVLSGRDAAARKSWQSVLEISPGTDLAKQAQSYLDQLGPETPPSGR